jgi:hypothetical protein
MDIRASMEKTEGKKFDEIRVDRVVLHQQTIDHVEERNINGE